MTKLVVIGAINWDINFFVSHLPKKGEEVLVHNQFQCPGGTGANVAVAAARLMEKKHVSFISGLGTDTIATKQKTIMSNEGVNIESIFSFEGDSGQAYITIDNDGENTITTIMGANGKITPQHFLEKSIQSLLKEARVIVITDPPLNVIPTILGLNLSACIILDPGVRVNELNLNIIAKCDYVVLNEVEFTFLFQKIDLNSEICQNTSFIIKKGKEGCYIQKQNDQTHIKGVDLKRLGLSVVNTVGCGDAFLGGFAASLAQKKPITQALTIANLTGAINATKKDTRGSPTQKELAGFKEK